MPLRFGSAPPAPSPSGAPGGLLASGLLKKSRVSASRPGCCDLLGPSPAGRHLSPLLPLGKEGGCGSCENKSLVDRFPEGGRAALRRGRIEGRAASSLQGSLHAERPVSWAPALGSGSRPLSRHARAGTQQSSEPWWVRQSGGEVTPRR